MGNNLYKALNPQNLFRLALKEYLADKKRGTQAALGDKVDLFRSHMTDFLAGNKTLPMAKQKAIASEIGSTYEEMLSRGQYIVFDMMGDEIRKLLQKTGHLQVKKNDIDTGGRTQEDLGEEKRMQNEYIKMLISRQKDDQVEISYLRQRVREMEKENRQLREKMSRPREAKTPKASSG